MDSIRKLVLRALTKSCLLDPVPANILKDCLDELLPSPAAVRLAKDSWGVTA